MGHSDKLTVPAVVAPPINREALIMRIAAYLRINELTDPLIAKLLLEEAYRALLEGRGK